MTYKYIIVIEATHMLDNKYKEFIIKHLSHKHKLFFKVTDMKRIKEVYP